MAGGGRRDVGRQGGGHGVPRVRDRRRSRAREGRLGGDVRAGGSCVDARCTGTRGSQSLGLGQPRRLGQHGPAGPAASHLGRAGDLAPGRDEQPDGDERGHGCGPQRDAVQQTGDEHQEGDEQGADDQPAPTGRGSDRAARAGARRARRAEDRHLVVLRSGRPAGHEHRTTGRDLAARCDDHRVGAVMTVASVEAGRQRAEGAGEPATSGSRCSRRACAATSARGPRPT